MKNKEKSKNGFTLIELLVVIVIIGILAAIVVLNLSAFVKEKARIARLQKFADSVRGQLSSFEISWWRLNGDGNDNWDNNIGTLINMDGSNSVDDLTGKSLQFNAGGDGDGEYINTNFAPNFSANQSFTVSLWFKTNPTLNGFDFLIGSRNGDDRLKIFLGPGGDCPNSRGKIEARVESNWNQQDIICSSKRYDDEKWHFLVLSFNRTQNSVKLNIDAEPQGELSPVNATGDIDLSGSPLFIGAWDENDWLYYQCWFRRDCGWYFCPVGEFCDPRVIYVLGVGDAGDHGGHWGNGVHPRNAFGCGHCHYGT